ncbi:MAG: amidohydrolase family protein [Bacteroidia bacterium]|nr:amidohydrolase family protein [Bacteroidia bacterium]
MSLTKICTALLLYFFCIMGTEDLPKKHDLAIVGVNVFDTQTKEIQKGKTILINGDEITAIVDVSAKVNAKQTIDGKGRLVVPGFIDTHAHLNLIFENQNEFTAWPIVKDSLIPYRNKLRDNYLAYGTTTITGMGQPESWMSTSLNWQKNPSPTHPNLFIAGGAMISDESRQTYMNHTEVMGPDSGREKVRKYAEMGLRHIKLYWRLQKRDMKAIVKEAHKEGLIPFGHIDNNIVTIQNAMDLGVKNFEHFFTLAVSALKDDNAWKVVNEKYDIPRIQSTDEFAAAMSFFFGYVKDNPESHAKMVELLDRMAEEGASISTTIHILAATAGKTSFFSSFEHFPKRDEPHLPAFSSKLKSQIEPAFESLMYYLKMAHDKGVKIRIGTDCRYGGKALLSELILMKGAGFSTEDILQIACYNGYESMQLTDQYGSIEAGKKADLLIFEKDPFSDPMNFLSKKTIIKGGQIFENSDR